MKKYFDAHVYLSNFGSRALHLRLPLTSVDREAFRPYEVEDVVQISETKTHLVISIFSEEQPGRDYDEHDGDPSQVIHNLLPLRNALLRGDLRTLYIGWLRGVENSEGRDKTPEPPVPAGLGERDDTLECLTSFLWLDPELVETAARNSSPELS